MRYAVLAYHLRQSPNESLNNFKLVLPPWSSLYHWKHKDEPEKIPWSYFFDITSLQAFAPVIELHEFFDGRITLAIFLQYLHNDNFQKLKSCTHPLK